MKIVKKQSLKTKTILTLYVTTMFILFLVFDLFFADPYKINGENDFYWFTFWTHLSNIGAVFWINIWLLASWKNSQKLSNFINNWFIKNLVFTFIIVTGIAFMSTTYIPTFYEYSKPGIIDSIGRDPSFTYRFFVIFNTTNKHFFIPFIFIYISLCEKETIGINKDIKNKDKTMIISIFPFLYFIYIIFVTSLGVDAPYPIVNFTSANSEIYIYVLYLCIDIFVLFLFLFISYIQFEYWNKK